MVIDDGMEVVTKISKQGRMRFLCSPRSCMQKAGEVSASYSKGVKGPSL